MTCEDKWWQTQLAKDVHSHLRKREIELPVYRCNSPQICYRRFLVNWLALIGEKLGLLQEVIHLAVRYLDHVMDRYELLMESQLNILALCCLSLAGRPFVMLFYSLLKFISILEFLLENHRIPSASNVNRRVVFCN